MAKYKLNQTEYNALTPEKKLEYVAAGPGVYTLSLEDYEDPAPLLAARDREKQDAAELRTKNAALTAEVVELKKATPQDVRTLQAAHETALTAEKTASTARIESLRKGQETMLLNQATQELATSLTATPENANLLKPHLQARVVIEWDGDKAVTKIKNSDGSVGSVLTPDTATALKKDFIDNPVFGAIVVKSKASGGGAAGGQAGVPGGAGTGQKKFSEMSGVEKTSLYTSDLAEFNRLAEADKADRAAARSAPLKPLFQQ